MSEKEIVPDAVEQPKQESIQEARQVPLEALEAERRKRKELEVQNRTLQEFLTKSQTENKKTQEDDLEDDDDFITKAEMKKRIESVKFSNKREILEEAFAESNPKAVQLIDTHLEEIIKRKPWLAQSIESSPNRYARAHEIVLDYMPKEESPMQKLKNPQEDAKKIVENSQKPGSPQTIAKSSSMSNVDYLKSIAGKSEFREYRKKLMGG